MPSNTDQMHGNSRAKIKGLPTGSALIGDSV